MYYCTQELESPIRAKEGPRYLLPVPKTTYIFLPCFILALSHPETKVVVPWVIKLDVTRYGLEFCDGRGFLF